MATESDSRRLSDLRVVDLRAELEKRDLDKSGNKASLTEKLQVALISEGHNPEEYIFGMADKKSVNRLSISTKLDDPAGDKDGNLEKEELGDKNDNKNSIVDSADDQGLTNEKPSLETTCKGKEDSEFMNKKTENVESPLNLSIGEEEENLLLNSSDEQDKTDSMEKRKNVKNATKNIGVRSNTTKESNLASLSKKLDKVEAHGGKLIEKSKNVISSSRLDSTTSETAVKEAISPSSTAASDNVNKIMKSNPGRSLWVTNLSPSTRAQELKHLLSRYGKVIGAKVVQSSRNPRTQCYGYVTMETKEAADLCIEKLNKFKGHIRVARVRPEHCLAMKTVPKTPDNADKSKNKSTADKQIVDKTVPSAEKKQPAPVVLKVEATSSAEKKDEKLPVKKDSITRTIQDGYDSSKQKRSLSPKLALCRDKKLDILTIDKIREERERQRVRERDRAIREEEKRRQDVMRAREIEKRQREEEHRLEREREKLRVERERLDRQRQEILRLERDRQKLEREKLEQEKQELRQEQIRLEEARTRPVKRPAAPAASNYRREGAGTPYSDDRKRVATERHYEDTPPPPCFEVSAREPVGEVTTKKEISKEYKNRRIVYNKRTEEYNKRADYKREFPTTERQSSTGHMMHTEDTVNSSKYSSSTSYVNREREIRDPNRREAMVPNVPPPRISKEARYSERSSERSPVSYRPVRDDRERRPISEHHTKNDIRPSREHRYGGPSPSMKDNARYREGNAWHSSDPLPSKPFGGMSSSGGSSREPWSQSDNWRPMATGSNERWVGNNSSRILMAGSSGVPNTLYPGGNSSSMSGIGAGMSCPPPPGSSSYSMDRFDSYKSMNSSRKY